MLWFLVGLTAFSFLLLLIGFVWVLVRDGNTTRQSGQEVGREIMAEQMEGDDETLLIQETAFRGRATSVKTEASYSFVEIKSQAKNGQWSEVLPVLMAIVGLLGLLLFGSLALFVAMDDRLVGGLIAVVGVFATLRVVVGLIRA
ncbi:MAG TPA: hypothetical protein VLE70_00920 [Anaerolineae bacterium]|jgi:hypothetical protein|nr:hypothetical protein [Anaerolineae bacterium]